MKRMDGQWEYENLANAIITQAVKDYRAAGRNSRVKDEVIRFIRSDWFGVLTDLDPVMLEKRLREEDEQKWNEYPPRGFAAPASCV